MKSLPQIIAEKYIEDDTDGELKDYKILCFNGKPENIMVCTGRFSGGVKYYFFDKEWNFLRLNHGDNELPNDFSIKRPQFLHEMLDIAEKLSTGFVCRELICMKHKVKYGLVRLRYIRILDLILIF